MKLIVRIQLLPDADQSAGLKAVTGRFNAAADWLAGQLFEAKVSNKMEAQRLFYREVRERFGLSSQTAILCIHRACEACKRDKAVRPRFRGDAAITYDVRTMSFKGVDKVSLLTLDGRVVVPMIVTGYQAERLGYPKGQCDLVLRKDGKWFLMVTVNVPDDSPIDPVNFIGVDLGIANIATDSDGNTHSGADVEKVRRKHNLQRKRLGRKNTKGSRKKIRRMRDKEARFRRHENHVVSKELVESAKRTGRGIALEDLEGIRHGSRLGVERPRIGSRVGPSHSSDRSSRTRPSWRVSPWNTSTRETPAGLAPSAGIARSPTERASPNSGARRVATRHMPIETPPGTSGLWHSLSVP